MPGEPTVAELQAELDEAKREIDALRARLARGGAPAGEDAFERTWAKSGVPAYHSDTGSWFLRVNRAMCRFVGYSSTELLRMRTHQVLHPDGGDAGGEDATTESGEARCERRFVRKDGEVAWGVLTTRPVRDDSGRLLYLEVVVEDVTALRRAAELQSTMEAQLLQIRGLQGLGVVAGQIAHELNNLLSGILGYAELALDEISPRSSARRDILLIEQVAQRAAGLLSKMQAFASAAPRVAAPLELSAALERVRPLLESCVSKKADLDYQIAPYQRPIDADETALDQLLVNLVTNASEALAGESGVITISAGAARFRSAYLAQCNPSGTLEEGLHAYLSVTDTGLGMDQATQAKVFKPFFTTRPGSSGLGLSAVLGIVRDHGAAIHVRSRPGLGSTFTVVFPISTASVADEEVETPADRERSRRGWVLVADDEAHVREVARRMLERSGYSVLVANDGLEAIRTFQEHAADITAVVLDLAMPTLDGDQACREILAIRADVPILISSGYEGDRSRFDGLGVAGFLKKPYRSEHLVGAIQEALGRR